MFADINEVALKKLPSNCCYIEYQFAAENSSPKVYLDNLRSGYDGQRE